MDKYIYQVSFSPTDNDYVAPCVAFSSLSYLDEQQDKAVNGIVH